MKKTQEYQKYNPNSNRMFRLQIALFVVLISVNYAFTKKWEVVHVPITETEFVDQPLEYMKENFIIEKPKVEEIKPEEQEVRKPKQPDPPNPNVIEEDDDKKKDEDEEKEKEKEKNQKNTSQQNTKPAPIVFDYKTMIPDAVAEFPGGMDALKKYLSEETEYPGYAARDGVECEVTYTFVVGEDGVPFDFQILKISQEGYGFEAELLRTLKRMPRWKPGTYMNKNVPTRFVSTMIFELDDPIW